MDIAVLGSGTGWPALARAFPALYLNAAGDSILADCGSGTIRQLLKVGITYHDLNYLLISHLHPDHTLDLVSLLFAATNPLEPRMNELLLIGPRGLKDFYKNMLKVYGDTISPRTYSLVIKEISDDKIDLPNIALYSKPVKHSSESIGFRMETKNGKSLCYSGDTDYCENIVELSRNADLAVLECSFPDELDAPGHLSPAKVCRIARESGCKKVLLTHMYPVCDSHDIINACKRSCSCEILLSSDLLRMTV